MDAKTVVELFTVYAQSHIYFGMEVIALLILYACLQPDGTLGIITMWSGWLMALALVLGPWWFNPHGVSLEVVSHSFFQWCAWIDGTKDKPNVPKSVGKGSWEAFHEDRMNMLRGNPLGKKSMLLSIDLLPRSSASSPPPPPSTSPRSPPAPRRARLAPPPRMGRRRPRHHPRPLRRLRPPRPSQIWAAPPPAASRAAAPPLGLPRRPRRRPIYGWGWLCDFILTPTLLGWLPPHPENPGTPNVVLLGVCAVCSWAFVVELLCSLKTPEKPKDSYAGALHEILRQIKLALRGYADEWYAALDHLYGLAIIATLFVFTVLPLAALRAAGCNETSWPSSPSGRGGGSSWSSWVRRSATAHCKVLRPIKMSSRAHLAFLAVMRSPAPRVVRRGRTRVRGDRARGGRDAAERAAAATSTSKASRRNPPPRLRSPAEHESLAQLCAATLTVAGFLAPKGVPCTLDRLVGPVRALGQTLTHTALKQIVSIDDRLVLRSFVGPGETQPLLVMREQLKLVATPAAVRARDRRFRELLQAHAAAEPAAAAPPPPPPPPTRRRHAAAAAAAATSADELGLPSPPPKPLRRVVSSELEEATAQDGMHPMQPPGPTRPRSGNRRRRRHVHHQRHAVDRALAELEGRASTAGRCATSTRRRRGRRGS